MRRIKHDEILNNLIYEYEYYDDWELIYKLRVDSKVLESCACWECLWFDELEENELDDFI